MQSAYISKLLELAEKDHNVLHLLADSGTGYDEMFRRNFPDQIFNFGIGEENMVAAAAGLASAGKIPFVYTAGAFLCYRSLEFIRNDICFQNLNVKVVGMGSGLAWSSLGPTHHTTEDIAVLRSLPGLMILSPSTPNQVMAATELAYKYKGPVYIRIGMNKEKEFFAEDYTMGISKNDLLFEGGSCIVFTTGSILEEAHEAVCMLRGDGYNVGLVNVTTIKPFDVEGMSSLLQNTESVITVEEHNVIGGLGSILSEVIACKGLKTRLFTIGINDSFASGYGSIKEVRKINGLDAESLYHKVKKALKLI